MVFFGVIIGLLEIIIGVVSLITSLGNGALIWTGIGCILSGILFIWLCLGSQRAFENSDEIARLNKKVRTLEGQNKLYMKFFKNLGISEEDLNLLNTSSLESMQPGSELVSLVEKKAADGSFVIPKGTTLSFYVFSKKDKENEVVVDVVIDGKTHRVRYKQSEVIAKSLYTEKENKE